LLFVESALCSIRREFNNPARVGIVIDVSHEEMPRAVYGQRNRVVVSDDPSGQGAARAVRAEFVNVRVAISRIKVARRINRQSTTAAGSKSASGSIGSKFVYVTGRHEKVVCLIKGQTTAQPGGKSASGSVRSELINVASARAI